MKPFNLEEFKSGVPAVQRNGTVRYFVSHEPDEPDPCVRLLTSTQAVGPGTESARDWYYEDGRYVSVREDEGDLIGMVEGWSPEPLEAPTTTHPRTESSVASAYRLARRNGELILQGAFQWTCGMEGGVAWRDIPVHEEDEE